MSVSANMYNPMSVGVNVYIIHLMARTPCTVLTFWFDL